MKKIILLTTVFLLVGQGMTAQKTITADQLPTTIDAFVDFRNEVAKTPEGGAAVFALAILMYTKDQEVGKQALTVAIDKSHLSQGDTYKGYSPPSSINYHLKRLLQRPYIARTYVKGTDAKQGYKLPSKLKFESSRNPYSKQSNGDIKVYIQCSGADSPRPITLRKNNRGLWKAVNYNSLFVGTVPPVVEEDDDL